VNTSLNFHLLRAALAGGSKSTTTLREPHCGPLPRDDRDAFLRNIASRLSACPTDAEVREAVAAAMG
jgi:hypothetical protein